MHNFKENSSPNKYEYEYLDLSSLEEGSLYNIKCDIIKKFLRINTGKICSFILSYADKESPRIKEEEKKLQYLNLYDYHIDFIMIFELKNNYLHILGSTYEDELMVGLFDKKDENKAIFIDTALSLFDQSHDKEDIQIIEKPELFVFV